MSLIIEVDMLVDKLRLIYNRYLQPLRLPSFKCSSKFMKNMNEKLNKIHYVAQF